MAISLENTIPYVASALASKCRREEIIIDLCDSGMTVEDASQLIGEMEEMRDNLRRGHSDKPVSQDALLAHWHEQRGETKPEVIATWRKRGRMAAEARQRERVVENPTPIPSPVIGIQTHETSVSGRFGREDANRRVKPIQISKVGLAGWCKRIVLGLLIGLVLVIYLTPFLLIVLYALLMGPPNK